MENVEIDVLVNLDVVKDGLLVVEGAVSPGQGVTFT